MLGKFIKRFTIGHAERERNLQTAGRLEEISGQKRTTREIQRTDTASFALAIAGVWCTEDWRNGNNGKQLFEEMAWDTTKFQ